MTYGLSYRETWTLFAAPDIPSAVWLYIDDAGQVVYECGTCAAWWYAGSDDGPLWDELICAPCDAARSAWRWRPRPPKPAKPSPLDVPCGLCGHFRVESDCRRCRGTGEPQAIV